MLLNQNQTANLLGVNRSHINHLSKKFPRPGYFVYFENDTMFEGALYPAGLWINPEHPEFKYLMQKREFKKSGVKLKPEKSDEIMDLINAVDKVITSEYNKAEAEKIKHKIMKELTHD